MAFCSQANGEAGTRQRENQYLRKYRQSGPGKRVQGTVRLIFLNIYIFFFLLYPEIFLHYYTLILQRIRIIVGDAGFEPRTSAPEGWCATMSHHSDVRRRPSLKNPLLLRDKDDFFKTTLTSVILS